MTSLLSKSRFLAGLQCHLHLYWRVHEPKAPELTPNADLQALFDTGRRVGERARAEFPGAVLIDADRRRLDEALVATKQALDGGATTILEASFREDGIFVAVDALTKEPDGWVLTEVKSTASVKSHHIPDAAVQAHVVERAGLPVKRVEIMHLNTSHRHPDQGPLFTRTDITDDVAAIRPSIAPEIHAQRAMLEGPLPAVEPGEHCNTPRLCPFHERCHVPAPEHSIEELNGIRAKLRTELYEAGIETIDQIPSDFPLSPLHSRHRASVRANDVIVEPGLREQLARYAYPIAMLDFETVNLALPIWDGCHPFEAIPVQFSAHMLHEDGRVDHHGYLVDTGGLIDTAADPHAAADTNTATHADPRPRVAAELAEVLPAAATILAWNASFEKRCLETLAEASPAHAPVLRAARAKLHDLLPVVRNHLYHPDFRGRFGIKPVAAALLPHLSHEDLEVTGGQTASWQLERLLFRPEELTEDERRALRQALEAYCKRDTEVMVALFRLLVDLSA